MFYCEELTSGSASTALRNLCQGYWPAAPAVAIGNVTGALDISNTTIQGTNISSAGAGYGCEYSGTIPNCGYSGGGTIPGPITFGTMTTGTTSIQQTTTTPGISPSTGSFSSPPTVTFSSSQPNVSYFYTTNGTTPTTASTLYTGSFACASLPCTVKVLSQWGTGAATAYPFPSGYGWAPSAVATATYTPSSTVTISTTNPPYGWTVETGAKRQVAVYPSGGATNKVNWSISSGGTITGCTSNCIPTTEVVITAAGGTCSVTGAVGAYVFHSTSDVTLTATSVDDGTKTATIPFHVCDTTGSAYVDVEPSYNQAFQGQLKTLQSYVIGYTNQNVTWSILSQPAGGNGAFVDTVNRDTQFSATVTGRYVLKATSAANSGLSGTAIIYVSPNALPRAVTPNKTEPTECYVDPAFTGPDFEVGPARTYTTLKSIGTVAWTVTGALIRIHNDDITGMAPTTYHEAMQIQANGTATQPMYICGVADSLGNLPVIDGSNATEDSRDSPYLAGAGALKFVYTNSNYGLGYEVGSTGPDYVSVTGIRIQNFNDNYSYYPNGSPTLTPYTGAAGIYVRAGRHVHYEGIDMNNVGWGVLDNNNTTYTGSSMTLFHQFIGGHISNFSDTNSYSEHALYMEAFYTLIEGNLIENPTASDNGNFMKVRGGTAIIRYNGLIGQLGGNTIAFPDMEDTFQFVSVDDNLGPIGGTCGQSVWCTITSNNITIPHLVQNEEALAHDYVYGNVLSNPNAMGFPALQYGSYSAPNECPPCTNMADRQGRLYFWNNTIDKPTDSVITTANPYTGSYFPPLPQYSFTTVSAYNNAYWNASSPFVLAYDTTAIYNLQTNMFPTGVMSLTPTTGGSGGWGNWTGPYAFPLAVPIDGHINGLTSGNFLTTSTLPYNATTFLPITSSPLIGAGGAITDPEISAMPVRSQPNVTTGFISARSAGATTIGAEENGAPPTIVNNPTCTPVAGTYYAAQSVTCSSTTPSSTTYCTIDGTTPTSGSPICTSIAVTASLTLKAISEASGLTNSSVVPSVYTITLPTVNNPTFSPAAGTYTSPQTIAIATSTPGGVIVYTTDGSTPAASGGVASHGTTWFTDVQNPAGAGTWTQCSGTACAGGTNTGSGTATFVSSTPLGADSIIQTSNGNGFNTMYYRHLGCPNGSCTAVNGMTEDEDFYIPSASNHLQALEFDPDLYDGSYEYFASVQCDSASGFWRFWNGSAWATSSYACSILTATNTAHHMHLETVFDTTAHTYGINKMVVDGTTVCTSCSSYSAVTNSGAATVNIEQQIDNNSSATSNSVYYSNLSLQMTAIPLIVSTSQTVKALGTISGGLNSSVVSAAYAIIPASVANPVYSPIAGNYTSAQSVAITTTTPGASVIYTTDGTTPSVTALTCTITNGTLYTGAVSVATSQTLNALGCLSGDTASGVVSAAYVITVLTPTFSPIAGTYASSQSITIATATGGASVVYTNDGSTPTVSSGCTITNGTLYSGAVTVATSQTLKAIGCKTGLAASGIGTAAYSIVPPGTIPVLGGTGIQIKGSGVIFK